MELETLEVVLSANLEKMEEQFAKIMPFIDKTMAHVERVTGQGISKTEKNMDVEQGTTTMIKQMEKMTQVFEKQMEKMNKTATSNSEDIGKNMSKGFSKARKHVGKDIDAIINEINSKMGQAKAQQEKLAFLRSQRQGAVSSNDTKGTVKYDEQIARAQAAMTKYQDSAKGLARSIQSEFAAVPASLDNITNKMAQNEGQIEKLRSRIKLLQAEYANQKTPVGNFTDGFKNIGETKGSTKTAVEIDKQSIKMQKLIADNDSLQKAYAMTEDRATQLKSALSGINTKLGESSVKTGTAAEAVKKTSKGVNESRNNFSKFGGLFNRTSNNIAHGTRRMSNGMGGLGKRIGSIAKQVFVFSLIYKGLRLIGQGLTSALKTNDQFSTSLNQIKVNLLTAFYPIYTAILPAINALMSVVAKATGILASFIATLFGTTYSAAKQGAQGLYQNIQAMNDSGNAADKNKEKIKKLQRSLMGFDEINKIGLDEPEDEKTSNIDFNTPNFDVPSWASGANKLLTDFFKPFQDSWAKHGKRVTNAWKYALREVGGLVKAVGSSFMEVWTNGSGERFISNLLLLLANVLNIVGDIAKAFKDAWNDGGRGTALIQAIFDMWNNVLELINEVGESFRNVWNNGTGELVAANLLEIFTNIHNIVGNLAEGLKLAWTEGAVGESIFQGILDIVNNVLGLLNEMTLATAEWAESLDFTPLLQSIDGLLKSIEPLTKNIGDGLAWFYENVLLPIAGFTITSVIPAFLDVLSGAIDVLNSVVNALKPLGKWLFDKFLKPLAEWTGGVITSVLEGITSALKGVSDWIDNHQKTFEIITLILGSFATAWGVVSAAIGIWTIVSSIATGVTTAFGVAVGILTSPVTLIILAIGALIAVGVLLWKNWEEITEWASKAWGAIKESVSKATEATRKWVSEKWDNLKKKTGETWENIKKSSSDTWSNISKAVSNGAENARKWSSEKWDDLKKKTGETWETVKKGTRDTWNNVSDKVRTSAETARDKASNAWSNMKDKVGGFNDRIKSTTKTAFDSVASWAGNLGKRMGEGLAKGFEAVKKGAKSLGKGVIEFPLKAVNGVIKGVSWVLGKVGASEAAKSMKAYEFNYARGTNYHPGGRALINDGSGMNYQEAYRLPNGQTGLFPRMRNMVVDLPAGSSVLSGPETASMMSSGLPMYANGVGNWFKEKWNGIKKFSGDVWDYASNPDKLLEIGISKFTNLSGAMDPGLSIAKGAISKTASSATSFVKEKMESFFSRESGGHDGSIGDMGVYSYLSDVAKRVISRFPQMRMTSGMREGDPYYHGRRQAIDIAFPASMNGSSENMKAANYAFENFASKVGYVITNGKVRDRSGTSGQGSSGQWTRWPDNDHYDHVHINGLLGAGDIGKGGGGSSDSGGWRNQIVRASNLMKQNATSSEINGILAQIQRESSGNEKITQSSAVWDVNTASGNPAKGLLQYIPQTFAAYKVPGYGDILTGFHQLMAFFNNSNWRYDLPYGRSGWGPSGNRIRGFENGGRVNQDGLYRMGESNKEEWIFPMEKPSVAKKMVYEAMDYLGMSSDFMTLKLPDMFTEKPKSFSYEPQSNQQQFKGGGLAGMSEGVIQAIMLAIGQGGGKQNLPDSGDVIINIGGKEFGRISVKEINKYHEQIGHTELNI